MELEFLCWIRQPFSSPFHTRGTLTFFPGNLIQPQQKRQLKVRSYPLGLSAPTPRPLRHHCGLRGPSEEITSSMKGYVSQSQAQLHLGPNPLLALWPGGDWPLLLWMCYKFQLTFESGSLHICASWDTHPLAPPSVPACLPRCGPLLWDRDRRLL